MVAASSAQHTAAASRWSSFRVIASPSYHHAEERTMTTSRLLTLVIGLTACIVLCSFLLFTPSYAQQPASDVAIDNDDIGGVVTGPEGPGGRRLGDRRDARPAGPLHQERRHRRPRPLRRARSAAGELPGVGARLRPGRQRQDDGQAGTARSTSRRWSRRTRPPRRTTTRRSTGTRC